MKVYRKFSVYFTEYNGYITYRIVEENGRYRLQEHLTNCRKWIDVYKNVTYPTPIALISSAHFQRLFFNL